MLKLGNTPINKFYLGSTVINKIYSGENIVFNAGGIQPLRIATVQNRGNRTRLLNSTNTNKQTTRVFQYFAGDHSSMTIMFMNWLFNSSGPAIGSGSAYNVDLASVTINGVTLPVYYQGVRNASLPDGTTHLVFDELLPAQFGLPVFPDGGQIEIKYICSTPHVSPAYWPMMENYNGVNFNSGDGYQSFTYNPSITNVSSVDVSGVFTTTGTAPTLRNSGIGVYVVGRPVNPANPSVFGTGDSIYDSRDDTNTNGNYGKGIFQRAMSEPDHSGAWASLNFAVSGSRGEHWDLSSSFWVPLLPFFNIMVTEHGTNDRIVGNRSQSQIDTSQKSIWSKTRDNAPHIKIVQSEYLCYTTGSFGDDASQNIVNGWQAGNIMPNLNTAYNSYVPSIIDGVSPSDAARSPTNYYKWVAGGTDDGLHPTTTVLDLASDLRATIQGIL